jgi:hypothetical protein
MLAAITDRSVDRAQEHLETIKGRLLSHYEADEYLIAGEYQRDVNRPGGAGTFITNRITFPEIDPRLNTIIGEYVHDLRSGLDHLARLLVLESKGTPTDGTHFPIKDTDPGTDKKGRPRTPGVSGGVQIPAAQALIRSAQPYQWGSRYIEHPLWLLHQLWNIDKHRYVIAKGTFGRFVVPLGAPAFRFSSQLNTATPYEAKLLLVANDPGVNVNGEATVEVAIHEPDYGIEQPLLGTLEKAGKMVQGIVDTALDTCFPNVGDD